MKPWDTFLPDVLPHCPGCPDLVAEDEIRNAAEEFLEKSYVWRYAASGMTTVQDQTDYTPTLPANARMVKLHEATLAGAVLDIDDIAEGETGSAYKACTPDMVIIRIGPDAPAPDLAVKVRLSLSITKASTGLTDELYNAYSRQIAYGAVARICAHADKPYTNPQKSGTERARFLEEIDEAKYKKARGNSSAPARNKSHFF